MNKILYLRYAGPCAEKPEDDYLTMGLSKLLEIGTRRQLPQRYQCSCGYPGADYEVELPDGSLIGPLAHHYLRFHRDGCPLEEVGKVFYQLSKHGLTQANVPVAIAPEDIWVFTDQLWVAPDGMEHEGTLIAHRSADGIILDFLDDEGNTVATNGLDFDCLTGMLKPN